MVHAADTQIDARKYPPSAVFDAFYQQREELLIHFSLSCRAEG